MVSFKSIFEAFIGCGFIGAAIGGACSSAKHADLFGLGCGCVVAMALLYREHRQTVAATKAVRVIPSSMTRRLYDAFDPGVRDGQCILVDAEGDLSCGFRWQGRFYEHDNLVSADNEVFPKAVYQVSGDTPGTRIYRRPPPGSASEPDEVIPSANAARHADIILLHPQRRDG